jgi:uncharacterized protein (DUF1810 family)
MTHHSLHGAVRRPNANQRHRAASLDHLIGTNQVRTHWIWFIFPQLAGLGYSATAQRYAIRDLEQARRYLADPLLGGRLRDDVRRMIGHKDRSAQEILGSPDDLKFRSCLTLFRQAASEALDQMLFNEALDQFYDGNPDPRTLELLGPQLSCG